eukprot:1025388-Prorocentrum_minimum.AAC.1
MINKRFISFPAASRITRVVELSYSRGSMIWAAFVGSRQACLASSSAISFPSIPQCEWQPSLRATWLFFHERG